MAELVAENHDRPNDALLSLGRYPSASVSKRWTFLKFAERHDMLEA
jgi:hypothetical protein